jgi:hypothetical protein
VAESLPRVQVRGAGLFGSGAGVLSFVVMAAMKTPSAAPAVPGRSAPSAR